MIVISIHEDEGVRTALVVAEGPKFLAVIWPDSAGMRIRKIRKSPGLRITELPDYPVARAKKIMRKCGRNFGITKGAKKALRG